MVQSTRPGLLFPPPPGWYGSTLPSGGPSKAMKPALRLTLSVTGKQVNITSKTPRKPASDEVAIFRRALENELKRVKGIDYELQASKDDKYAQKVAQDVLKFFGSLIAFCIWLMALMVAVLVAVKAQKAYA